MDSISQEENMNIKLGDIVELLAPTNDLINNKYYFVKFIDSNKIVLLGKEDQEIILTINDNGEINDESITAINIINRAPEEGFARQNNLLPNSWIDIYFGGDMPLIITGLITNLENDMIEIKTYPNEDIIYIDFEYKGLPTNLPIDKIVKRKEPQELSGEKESQQQLEASIQDSQFESIEDRDLESMERKILIEPKDIILDADQIQIGEELDDIIQVIEVPESELRYGIDKQMDDMLNELLSTIPNQDRTPNKLNNVHKIIERYKELRDEFSIFNKNTNEIKPKVLDDDYKPLVNTLKNLSKKLYWILPIVKNNKKVYDTEIDEGTVFVEDIKLSTSLIEQSECRDIWKSNIIPDEQNKYAYFLRQLNPLLTPFTNNNISDYIIDKNTECNLLTIINNLGDENSYVSKKEELIVSRFITQVYNTGFNRLISEINEERKIINSITKVTENDKLLLIGLMIMPYPVFNFSYINLPTTSILKRSNLNKNFLSYWKFLNSNTLVDNIYISNLKTPINYKSNSFLNNIKQFLLAESVDKSKDNLYENFLNTLIPSTNILFNLVKEKISGNISFYNIIQYLEPFEIYSYNLLYKDYLEIVKFLTSKILEYKKDFSIKIKESIKFQKQLENNQVQIDSSVYIIFNILSVNPDIKEAVLNSYNIIPENTILSQAELLDKIVRIDYGKLFMIAIAKISVDLMVSNVLDEFIEIEKKLSEEKLENECKKYIISKKYFALNTLLDDDNKQIYFDKKYDNTYYNILDEFKEESETMPPEEFYEFLVQKLKDNIGLNQIEAQREASSMINKQRPVIDGDYALLELVEGNNKIYKRENNKWIEDPTLSKDVFFEGNKFFCEAQFNCYKNKDDCKDDKQITKKIQKENLKKILNEFDEEYRIDLQKIKSNIDKEYLYNLENISKKIQVEKEKKLKYNNQFLHLASLIEENDIIESPFVKLRDYILGENDVPKRQEYIIQFVLKYTREAYDNENKYWLYCKALNTKLLPKFLYTIAQVFVSKGDFIKTLDIICAQQGTISEDGDKWIDKYSGYEIRSIDLNVEEGYDESGYKLQTRELLEDDAGNVLLQSSQVNLKSKEYSDPTIKTIINVVQALSQQMFISIEDQFEFIIKYVLEIQRLNLPSEKEYNLAIEKAQKRGDKKKITIL